MRKLTAGLLISSAIAAGGLTLASPAWAACGLGANEPTGNISGTGSRTDCSGTVTLTVRVRKDVFGPDITVAEASQTGFGNGSLTANGSCAGGGTYFTETISSSGNSIMSGRVDMC
ncbi:hypothetical protein ACGF5C_31200 [Micromonospora sp. NPDC047620]|uniref:hypothetical protein n=1 Tax=Micromonospora sp. NPDC047620 TaxID=3364251 RepID=UPI003719AD50